MHLRGMIPMALAALGLLCSETPAGAQAVSMALSSVGNPGNASDTTQAIDGSGSYGGVNYNYAIGTYDVTLTQYAAFLNAVAQSDPYQLYNPGLAYSIKTKNAAGILQKGVSGSYTYTVFGDGQNPVTYVSWLNAARFCNWLQNGQPTNAGETIGSTEGGSYTLNGDTFTGLETRNAGAQWVLPTENEWYKAAYYDPTLNLNLGGYWKYPMRTNAAPNNLIGPALYQANCVSLITRTFCVTQSSAFTYTQNYLTDVGSFTNSQSAYGTYDQGGEIYQWNETIVSGARGMRGSLWNNYSTDMQSLFRYHDGPYDAQDSIGFRVASIHALNLSNADVLEGQAPGAPVGTVQPLDFNSGDTLTYALPTAAGNDNASFQLSGSNLQTAAVLQAAIKNRYRVLVKVTNQAGRSVQQLFTISVSSLPYHNWKVSNFGASAGDPAVAGDTAAPGGDSIPNLMKYALNLDPMSIATPGLPVTGYVTAGGEAYLTLTYNQAISATDLTYTAEVSGDLQTWSSGASYTAVVSVTPNADGVTQTVVVRDLTPMSSAAQRFIRLKVAIPANYGP